MNPPRKVFKHPSSISLFNLHSKLNFSSEKGKTILELIESKSTFFEWALISSNLICFDDYTYNYIKTIGFVLTENAHRSQIEKREQYNQDTIQYNNTYRGDIILELDSSDSVKLYNLDYRLGFGQYVNETIESLIELSPSRLEFFIHTLPWFGLTKSAIERLVLLEPGFLFLKSTFDLLSQKYEAASDMMKGKRKQSREEYNENYSDKEPYHVGDPRYDRNENPWIDVFGEGDEAETAYWNTD